MNTSALNNQLLTDYQSKLEDVLPYSNNQKMSSSERSDSFQNLLTNALDSLNKNFSVVDQDSNALVTGNLDDLHTMMIHTTEAQLGLQTAVQIRNKAIDAYNEIKNMQF